MLHLQRIALLMLLLPTATLAGESQPAATADKPVDKKTCKMVTDVTAFTWYKVAICTKLHKDLSRTEKTIKFQAAANSPNFYKALTTPPLSTWGKDQASVSIYTKPEADFTLAEDACKMDLNFLKRVFIQDTGWKHALQKCWEGPQPLVHKALPPPSSGKEPPLTK